MRFKVPTDTELLERIHAFCAAHGMPPSTFGRNALGDGSLIANLEAGRSLTLRKAVKVARFMREYRPSPQQEAA